MSLNLVHVPEHDSLENYLSLSKHHPVKIKLIDHSERDAHLSCLLTIDIHFKLEVKEVLVLVGEHAHRVVGPLIHDRVFVSPLGQTVDVELLELSVYVKVRRQSLCLLVP